MNMGILSGFSGTVGTVIGSVKKNGDDIIRAKTKIRRVSQTEAQVNQRTKFGLVTQFMKPLSPLLKIGFSAIAGDSMSGYNYACMQALKKAVTGTAPDFAIDFSKIIISEGGLHQVVRPTAEIADGKVSFHWEDNTSSSNGQTTDQAIMVAFNTKNYEYSYSNGDFTRGSASGSLALPNSEVGDNLEIYLFFRTADGTIVSSSQYLGTVTVTE